MTARCPYCRKRTSDATPAAAEQFPFCSRRCRMADLDRWFSEDYAIPGGPEGVPPEEVGEGES